MSLEPIANPAEHRLARILGDSFSIMGHQFVVVYPFLLFVLIASLLVPQELPRLDVPWISMGIVLTVMYYAFMAGWYAVIEAAVLKYRKEQAAAELPRPTLFGAFSILKPFFNGVGAYFARFLLGGVIQLVLFALVFFAVWQLQERQGAMVAPALWERLLNMAAADVQTPEQVLSAFSEVELRQLAGFFSAILLGLAAYGLLYLMTVFWAPLIVVADVGVLEAYRLSFRQFFRDPFRLLFLGMGYVALNYGLTALVQFSSPLLLAVSQLGLLLLTVYVNMVLFLYLYSSGVYGPPEPPQGAREQEAASLAPPSDIVDVQAGPPKQDPDRD